GSTPLMSTWAISVPRMKASTSSAELPIGIGRTTSSVTICAKAASRKTWSTRSGSARENGPGATRLAQVWHRHMLEGSRGRHHEPGFDNKVPPAGEDEPAAGPEGAADVSERSYRIVEEHHAEAAHDRVEAGLGQRVDLGVALAERHAGDPGRFGAPPRVRQHRPGDIKARHRAAGRYQVAYGQRHRSVAAAHVEHPLTRPGLRRLHHLRTE